jgi:hypothetical protein
MLPVASESGSAAGGLLSRPLRLARPALTARGGPLKPAGPQRGFRPGLRLRVRLGPGPPGVRIRERARLGLGACAPPRPRPQVLRVCGYCQHAGCGIVGHSNCHSPGQPQAEPVDTAPTRTTQPASADMPVRAPGHWHLADLPLASPVAGDSEPLAPTRTVTRSWRGSPVSRLRARHLGQVEVENGTQAASAALPQQD